MRYVALLLIFLVLCENIQTELTISNLPLCNIDTVQLTSIMTDKPAHVATTVPVYYAAADPSTGQPVYIATYNANQPAYVATVQPVYIQPAPQVYYTNTSGITNTLTYYYHYS